ncbi:MAG: hypothetical protein ACPH3L_08980 [Flavobacteriaceae bacterium]
MKNIKYLALLLFSITLLVSCGQDDADSVTNPGTLNPTSEINIGFTDDNDGQLVLEGEEDNATTFTISLSTNPLPVATVITLGVSSSDGTTDGTSFPETVTIPAGDTSVDVVVSFTDDGVAEGTDVETVTIEILDADFGGDFDYYLTPGDITRTIDVTDSLPFSVVTEVGPLDMTFYWAGFSDLDAGIFSVAQGGFIDISQNFDQDPEFLSIPAAAPDGQYIFVIAPWSVASSSIDWLVEFEVVSHPVQTVYPFTGTLSNAGGFYSDLRNTIEITKSTNGSEVTYTIIQY